MAETGDLLDAINTAVEEGTLALKAVDAIKVLRDEHADLTKKLEIAEGELKTSREFGEKYRQAISDQGEQLTDYKNREEVLSKREHDCMRIMVESEYQANRVSDLRDIMLSLTRNLEHRRNLFDDKSGNIGPNGEWINNTVKAEEKSEDV